MEIDGRKFKRSELLMMLDSLHVGYIEWLERLHSFDKGGFLPDLEESKHEVDIKVRAIKKAVEAYEDWDI